MAGLPPPVVMPIQPPAIHAPSIPKSSNAAALTQSAQKFEAMAIAQMLQPMFNTIHQPGGPFGGGAGEEAWRSLMVEELAKKLAANGGLGLAKPIRDAMQRMQGASRK